MELGWFDVEVDVELPPWFAGVPELDDMGGPGTIVVFPVFDPDKLEAALFATQNTRLPEFVEARCSTRIPFIAVRMSRARPALRFTAEWCTRLAKDVVWENSVASDRVAESKHTARGA